MVPNRGTAVRCLADEKASVALGIIKRGYEVLQNVHAFQFFQPFIDREYGRFKSAGALGEGERVWILVKSVEPITDRIRFS